MLASRVQSTSRVVFHSARLRRLSTVPSADGHVIGIESGKLSAAGTAIDAQVGGKLSNLLREHKLSKIGDSIYFLGLHDKFPRIAVVSTQAEHPLDQREISRRAAAKGVHVMQKLGAQRIAVDPFYDAEATAEGSYLAQYSYKQFKNGKKDTSTISYIPLAEGDCASSAWARGKVLADAQNMARDLENAPANHITPSQFVKDIRARFAPLGNKVEIIERDKSWAEEKKMGCFLGVSQGSEEPLRFLEMHYKGAGDDSKPVVLVGKGVTFDSGGISIKPSNDMGIMRGDMSGAATVSSALLAAATLAVKRNVVVLAPLCENMPSGKATRPGDILTAMNGITVEIDNTDAEGRLILADALTYADSFNPQVIIDVATLTGAIEVALGKLLMGVYSTSNAQWELFKHASIQSGEAAWRMPLVPEYEDLLKSQIADIANSHKGRSGGSVVAATFLEKFVKRGTPWMHIDMAGVMHNIPVPYLSKGMTGIPVRTLVEFLAAEQRTNAPLPYERDRW